MELMIFGQSARQENTFVSTVKMSTFMSDRSCQDVHVSTFNKKLPFSNSFLKNLTSEVGNGPVMSLHCRYQTKPTKKIPKIQHDIQLIDNSF